MSTKNLREEMNKFGAEHGLTMAPPTSAESPREVNGSETAPVMSSQRFGHHAPAQSAPMQPAYSADVLAELLAKRRFDVHNPPPPAVARYTLAGSTIATPGNLVGVQAQAKAGKSAFLGAMMAATMQPSGDCLGVTAENPNGLAVVHFDTEQSDADHHKCDEIALRRAVRAEPPAWFRSYRVADLDIKCRRALIAFEVERAAQEHGGVHSVFLDGLADFIIDPNDTGEAFVFIAELHALAIKYSAPVVCVLHENPGSETGKTRGHLGSQLERKAETNLRLSKDGDVVTAYSERARHAHVSKDRGPRFQWSDEDGMHVAVENAATAKASSKLDSCQELTAEVFAGVPIGMGLKWAEILNRIGETLALKPEGARRHFDAMKNAGLIYKKGDKWLRN